jgi:hypothetical protein
MSELIAKVKAAISQATDEVHQQMANTPDVVLALHHSGKTLPDMRARAAIKVTLEHLLDNVSPEMVDDGSEAADSAKDEIVERNFLEGKPHPRAIADSQWLPKAFAAMISQALSEIEGSK